MSAFNPLFVFAVLCAFYSTKTCCSTAPRYTINLDLPPQQRFSQICKDYGKYLSELRHVISRKIPAKFLPLCEKIAASIDTFLPQPYADEMRGISKECNITLGDVVIFNLFYESTAYCTSIVAQDSNGKILHGRNFDYDFGDFLHNVTYIADFKSKDLVFRFNNRSGQSLFCLGGEYEFAFWGDDITTGTLGLTATVLYTAVMFAGHLGVATGQKPHFFSMSVDERDQGFWWENAFEAIFNRKAVIISFLTREVLRTEGVDFHQAVEIIANASLIAPAYFILGGVNPMNGAVITHNREKTDDIWYLGSDKSKWYLVETNYDHWTTPPPNDDRRHPAEKAMNATGQANISPDTLSKVLSVHPVLNDGTVYTTIMSAADPDIFYTYFP